MRIEQFEDIEAWQLARELRGKFIVLRRRHDFRKTMG